MAQTKFTFKGSGSTSKKRGRPKGSKNKPKVSASVKQYVKRTIALDQENKYRFRDYFDSLILSSSGISPLIHDLTPSVPQGSTKFTRVGSQAKIRNVEYGFRLIWNAAVDTANVDMPLNIYYAILRPRSQRNVMTTTETDQMFYSSNTVLPWVSGDAQAPFGKPNTDFFEYKYFSRRPIKLAPSTSVTPGYDNNDYVLTYTKTLNLTKWYNKTMRFNNDGATDLNNNWYIAWFVQKYNNNNTVSGWDAPAIAAQLLIEFEDA